jgi:glycosyltransferase involved in cell wall biosynthesis
VTLEILNVGRLARVKGQALLIRAIAELRDRGVDARATIVGEGPARAQLEREIRERAVQDFVTLRGAVGQDDIRSLYDSADVFCLPSFAEGVPVVLMEAMAMGRPVIATRIAGIPELVEHDVSGVLVAPGRVSSLVDALERLAGDQALRTRMGAAGRVKVQAEFDVRRSAALLQKLFATYSEQDGSSHGR